MARLGVARRGVARRGRRGGAWHGSAGLGKARQGWQGWARPGRAWLGPAWRGAAGAAWRGVARLGPAGQGRHGMTRLSITAPGVYEMTDEQYHADPVEGGSLSSTGARKLLPPSVPAKYRWWADNPPEVNTEFDFGHSAHKIALGTGPTIVPLDFPDRRTKAFKAAHAEARKAGQVPLLREEYNRTLAMGEALFRHPVAGPLFTAEDGDTEQTLIWFDARTGVWRRARLDWLPDQRAGRMVIADYKTCESAEPGAVERAIAEYGYHVQGGWYKDAVVDLGLGGEDTVFCMVFQEKRPPHLVNVVQLDQAAEKIGRQRCRYALEVYAECTAAGRWPGYGYRLGAAEQADTVSEVSLPRWIMREYENVSW
jgi:PDDEXK-like domain of unknown function (DUF3799)